MKNKRIAAAVGVVLFLALVVFINSRINQAAAKKTPVPSVEIGQAAISIPEEENYFEAFRENRENTREQELAYLDTIILHDKTDAEILADAQEQKLALVDNMEKEFTIEQLVMAKGFSDAAVSFHPGSVYVIVDQAELTEQDIAKVLDIVCRETGESAKNVKIFPATQ